MKKCIALLLCFFLTINGYSQKLDSADMVVYQQLVPTFLKTMDKQYRFNFNSTDTIFVDINRVYFYYYNDLLLYADTSYKRANFNNIKSSAYRLKLRNKKSYPRYWEFSFDSRYRGDFSFEADSSKNEGYRLFNYRLSSKSSHRTTVDKLSIDEFTSPPKNKK